jgi:multimeric flavodoxin WrbA
MTKVLGIAASLRNARWGAGNRALVEQLCTIPNRDALLAFLKRESELHLENFLSAGRREGKAFTEIYANLHKSNGDAGLSNSEIALSAALWAALKEGVEIEHLSLAEYFTAGGELRRGEELRHHLMAADSILISGPVYFGDRGSLAESLVDLIARDSTLQEALSGRLYGGIAVGAKRNGGQETTLIYQMMDMVDLGLLAVGNDHETTAQYGGTGHAGDVGTMHKDMYGIDTSMGIGRRIGRVSRMLCTDSVLGDIPRVLFLVLRDGHRLAAKEVENLIARFDGRMQPTVIGVSDSAIKRCIACDICPTDIDIDETYRCIIKSRSDDLSQMHLALLHHDVVVPVIGAVRDRAAISSNYQTFIERTRYLRRGDYALSDVVVAPLLVEEPGVHHSYAIRTMTSFIRHHTVLSRPIVARMVGRELDNSGEVDSEFARLLSLGARLAAGRLAEIGLKHASKYNPVGYVLSAHKDIEDERMQRRRRMTQAREQRLAEDAMTRLSGMRKRALP